VFSVLRDDALEVLEDGGAVADDVLVELDAGIGDLPQEMLESAPSLLQGRGRMSRPPSSRSVGGDLRGTEIGPAAGG
jgi:hypothetical protein